MSLHALFGGYFGGNFGFSQRFAHGTTDIATSIANIRAIIIGHSFTGHKIVLFLFLSNIKFLHLENIIIIMVMVIVIVVIVRQLCLFSLQIIKYS